MPPQAPIAKISVNLRHLKRWHLGGPIVIRHSGFVILPLLAASLLASRSTFADEPADSREFFEKHVRPVLSDQCFKCP